MSLSMLLIRCPEDSQIGKMTLLSFKKHGSRVCHKEAYEKLFTLPAITLNVGVMLSFYTCPRKG